MKTHIEGKIEKLKKEYSKLLNQLDGIRSAVDKQYLIQDSSAVLAQISAYQDILKQLPEIDPIEQYRLALQKEIEKTEQEIKNLSKMREMRGNYLVEKKKELTNYKAGLERALELLPTKNS